MAHVIDKPQEAHAGVGTQQQSPVDQALKSVVSVASDEDSSDRGFFSWPPSMGLVIVVVFLLALGGVTAFLVNSLMGPAPSKAHVAAADTASPGSSLVASDPKETAARDTYATNIAKELHQRVPAYKNVNIYADNWAGAKSPTRTPQTNAATRKGDNLMLVFSSPESGTAKGLSDFAKSKAAQEAAHAGFAELQFVDPQQYCYAMITPVGGVAPVQCGPR
jgi:cytoskeletal protein RodZ